MDNDWGELFRGTSSTTAASTSDSVTAAEILAKMSAGMRRIRELEKPFRHAHNFGFGGLKIVVSPLLEIPKVSLSVRCPCSDKVRDEFNAWLLEMFGTRNDEAYVFDGTVFCGPKTMAKLKGLGDA